MWEKIYDITDFLWGTPLMILMVGVGLYLSVRSGFFQITGIPIWWKKTIGEIFGKTKLKSGGNGEGEMKPFQAMSTVMAGTVGSGNIAGVATAIAVGGPGAVFWMQLIALVGMMTKMAEVTLAVSYRKKNNDGEYFGGPMHYMKQGLGKAGKVLAAFYSVALLTEVLADACFVQTNTFAVCVNDVYGVPLLITAIVVVAISAVIIFSGGVKKIGDFCGKMVPLMIVVYIVSCFGVIVMHLSNIPASIGLIFRYAFQPAPTVGGFVGSTVSLAIARGAARGIFSNEAGMGTSTTVHATAQIDNPVHQGMYGILEVFIVSFIICSLTALTVLASGVWNNGNTGVVMAFDAFRMIWGRVGIVILSFAVILFTFSSYIGFFVEFRTCVEYIFGLKSVPFLQWIFLALPIVSALLAVEQVWDIADMAVGFIVIPNMIALLLLSPEFFRRFKEYIKKCKEEKN